MNNLYRTFDAIRKSNTEARKRNDYMKLLENGQALLDYLPDLIETMVNQEHEYRKFEANLVNDMTSSKAETLAKATEFYREWQRAKYVIDWGYEAIQLSKKLASSVDTELKSQIK